MLKVSLYIVSSYLLGSIPFSIIICHLFKGVDVRKFGSGNAGATNVYRVAGWPAAIVSGLLDAAKGALPVMLARTFLPQTESVAIASGLAAVLGHIYPIFAGFRGGKGVNTLLGVFLILLPLEIALCILIFALTYMLTRVVSLGSLVAGVSLSLIVVIEKYIIGKNISQLLLFTCFAVTLLVFFTHRGNIQRLLSGKEKRMTK